MCFSPSNLRPAQCYPMRLLWAQRLSGHNIRGGGRQAGNDLVRTCETGCNFRAQLLAHEWYFQNYRLRSIRKFRRISKISNFTSPSHSYGTYPPAQQSGQVCVAPQFLTISYVISSQFCSYDSSMLIAGLRSRKWKWLVWWTELRWLWTVWYVKLI